MKQAGIWNVIDIYVLCASSLLTNYCRCKGPLTETIKSEKASKTDGFYSYLQLTNELKCFELEKVVPLSDYAAIVLVYVQ